jgi:hypothetical protein
LRERVAEPPILSLQPEAQADLVGIKLAVDLVPICSLVFVACDQ